MNYFFHPCLMQVGDTVLLGEEESRHASKSLRLNKGDKIHILNGMGQLAEGKLADTLTQGIQVQIEAIDTKTRGPKIAIAISALKNRDRLEWFVEKSVELQVYQICIFSSAHTEKGKTDLARLNRLAIGALKQSGNRWLPEIVCEPDFGNLLKMPFGGQRFMAHCRDTDKINLWEAYQTGSDVMVLIGPEGDFSAEEIILAAEKGFAPVSLGNLRLRSETAALAALMGLQIANQKKTI